MVRVFGFILILLLKAVSGWCQSVSEGDQYEKFYQSLTQAIQEESTLLENLSVQQKELQILQRHLSIASENIKLMLSTYANIISMPNVSSEDLERARSNLKSALTETTSKLEEIRAKNKEIEEHLKKTIEQRSLNEQHLKEFKLKEDDQNIVRFINQLIDILKKKEKLLRSLNSSYALIIKQAEPNLEQAQLLTDKIESILAKRKKEEFFQRKQTIITVLAKENLAEEIKGVYGTLGSILKREFWLKFFSSLPRATYVGIAVFIVLLVVCEIFISKARKFLVVDRFSETLKLEKPYFFHSLKFISSSISLIGATVFAYLYFNLNHMYDTSWAVRCLVSILIVWLFTRWFLCFIEEYRPLIGFLEDPIVSKPVKRLIHIIRWLIIVYIILRDAFELRNLLVVYRFFGKVLVFLLVVHFVQGLKEGYAGLKGKGRLIKYAFLGYFYLSSGGAVFVDLIGYSTLASFWLSGWCYSSVVLLWAWIVASVLLEWEYVIGRKLAFVDEESPTTRGSLGWLFIRLLWGFFGLALLFMILLSWGAKKPLFVGIFKILYMPISVGNFSFRIIGLFYAFIVVVITKVLSKKLRIFLREKLFKHSGLEQGLQESIISIVVYAFWFLGIIVALNVLGFSGTSLAVAFGAIGIGLGFGLQNIFNNFVSGIILLIERPIQVGDVVEIDGLWGVVKKINVRATVIQTFDNASYIIPNSEFISGRVLNWSFKDQRVRRSIMVGVSYGSDIELVKRTLIEAAELEPGVLREPEPDVLLKDFGDSSLVFQLRFWTYIDRALVVETNIRFNIDKLFRERNIEIPFPQRDIHIKSKTF